MTLVTTAAKFGTVLEAAGARNVQVRPGYPTDRALYEASLLTDDGEIERWTVFYTPVGVMQGADSLTEVDVTIVAVWSYDSDSDEFSLFMQRLEAVLAALLNPTTGFPQIDANGIQAVEPPGDPVPVESGHHVYRTQVGFHLLDVIHT